MSFAVLLPIFWGLVNIFTSSMTFCLASAEVFHMPDLEQIVGVFVSIVCIRNFFYTIHKHSLDSFSKGIAGVCMLIKC